jgi:hypothetical protein
MFQLSADASITPPLVEVEQPAESRPTQHAAGPEMPSPKRNQPIQTIFFDRS